MTLPPERIGDKGQRYEARYEDPDGEHVIGWGNSAAGAQTLADAMKLRPSTIRAWVVDREAPHE